MVICACNFFWPSAARQAHAFSPRCYTLSPPLTVHTSHDQPGRWDKFNSFSHVRWNIQTNLHGGIRPKMEYACTVWSGGPTSKLVDLQRTFCRRHNIQLPSSQKRFDCFTLAFFFKGSVERSRRERHFCSLLPYFLLSWLQIFQLCLFFCTSSPDLVLFKKFLQEKEKKSEKPPKTP